MGKPVVPIAEVRALALALERLRRAAELVLQAVEAGTIDFDPSIGALEEAHANSMQDSNTHLLWAQEALDGPSAPQRKKTGRKPESFDAVRKSAQDHNIYIHYVNTMEGSRFAVYKGILKVSEALTEKRCVAIMNRLMRATKSEGRSKR